MRRVRLTTAVTEARVTYTPDETGWWRWVWVRYDREIGVFLVMLERADVMVWMLVVDDLIGGSPQAS